ncbi:MAG: exodeoxyribonuclease V alpha subunit RecD [Idiomarinaceae bacterium HL-53]|nr:MAG: exodeoxyribonuclease V alpha subunit RecD [Idiomarinaceae bacterium HL-53]CUS48042.1 DNA helicase/exodeoxyribonuclease V, alpha subunit [Idiomarinaceae bacterium HL-53]
MQRNELIAILDDWQAQGWIRALDYQLASLLMRNGASAQVAFMGMLTSHQVGRGHTCLSIHAMCDNPAHVLEIPGSNWELKLGEVEPKSLLEVITKLFAISEIAALPSAWAQVVMQSPGESNPVRVLEQHEDALQPLVWDSKEQLLYLRRYWQHEKNISEWLLARMSNTYEVVDDETLRTAIEQVMPRNEQEEAPNWQRIACANAAKQSFSIITGGPGTGKTYTVVRVLATLSRLHTSASSLRIALAAPTGKAAARMQESIESAFQEADADTFKDLKGLLNRKASTLHRLLGAQANTRYFRHNQGNPLPFDVVVVDEASMIDTEMFEALLNAIGSETKLILLGDKDQLAPVEAGSVLASICQDAERRCYSELHWKWLNKVTSEALSERHHNGNEAPCWSDHIVMLATSHRFVKFIKDIALAVNANNVEAANEAIQVPEPALRVIGLEQSKLEPEALVKQLYPNFASFRASYHAPVEVSQADSWAANVLESFSQYQVLTALRAGPWGQRVLNTLFTQQFGGKPERWYHGRPVIVTANDYGLNLNNGDIGVALQHPQDGKLKVAFAGKQKDSVRWVLPSRLTDVETVYAMTVHKSQGSEFRHAVLVLPDRNAPVLTKELIYTGVTRAKKELTLVIPSKKVWEEAIQQKIERAGGLFKN